MYIKGDTVYITEYVGLKRFDSKTVYSFSKFGSLWFAKKRRGHEILIDEIK